VASQRLGFSAMLGRLKESLGKLSEHRTGKNWIYELGDAGLAAFSVFFMQSPSFLAHQRDMQRRKGHNNAEGLFGVERIPSDGQIRNLLDPVDPARLGEVFWGIYEDLKEEKYLDDYRGVENTRLISLDGTQYFSSQKVHCDNCRVAVRDEETYYSHQVLLAVVCGAEQPQVVCLEPEFITPQDGHDKQDCEQEALKRWVKRNAGHLSRWKVTVLADDLHAHQPVCELLRTHRMHFILTCKEESHPTLYEELELLTRVEEAVSTRLVRQWNGQFHEEWIYQWAHHLPLRGDAKTLYVNWCALTILHADTGEQLYHSAWITDHLLDKTRVVAVVRDGRSRWKVENEGINVLKNHGYHFEHNYGHGQQHLSTLLLTLLLLAFLFHTALALSCACYQAVRKELGTRRTFFNDLRALTRYLYFPSWQQLLTFMYQQLEIAP
jgi:hypothetical protein